MRQLRALGPPRTPRGEGDSNEGGRANDPLLLPVTAHAPLERPPKAAGIASPLAPPVVLKQRAAPWALQAPDARTASEIPPTNALWLVVASGGKCLVQYSDIVQNSSC